MNFKEIVILDWYDNIVNAFCISDSNIFFYCNLLAIDNKSDVKIYVAIELSQFEYSEKILDLIKSKSFLKNELELHRLLNVIKMNNQSFLIKTKDLKSNRMEIMEYKSNYNWNKSIFYIDYLKTLSKAKKIDNWWSYWG